MTGHSLGGAMATLFAAEMISMGHRNIEFNNFGSPRTGNTALYNYLTSNLGGAFRVTHAYDIVPHWPKAITYSGYHHIATEIWYNNDSNDNYKLCNSSGEDSNCSNGVLGSSVSDHTRYLGISTGCNNDASEVREMLMNSINGESLDFYDIFETQMMKCGSEGIIESF